MTYQGSLKKKIYNTILRGCLDPNPLTRFSASYVAKLIGLIILDEYLITQQILLTSFLNESNLVDVSLIQHEMWKRVLSPLNNVSLDEIRSLFKSANLDDQQGGSYKITFYIDGKKRTQKVHLNKRGTKCVNIKGELVPISKLKKSPPK